MTFTYNLAAIKDHPEFPFSAWQSDDVAFLMTELYWAELAREVIGSEPAALGEWQPLFETTRDGNPILSLANTRALRSLRVVMLGPRETEGDPDPDVTPFLGETYLDDGETEILELGMFARISLETEPVIRELIEHHCLRHDPPEMLEAMIAAFEYEHYGS